MVTDINETQKKRLAYIEFRLNFLGSISRRDLKNRFGIQDAAATRDISLYKDRAGKNIKYNEVLKIYERSNEFQPIFSWSANQVLTALSQGFGEDVVGSQRPLIACETPTHLSAPSIDVISILSRAIHQKKIVKISYRSVSSGQTEREIAPFALVDNGLRWHVRAFDRRRAQFRDFVLTRISSPSISESTVGENESKEFDNQWNRIVEMELAAHPRLAHPETIEQDYGMENGVLRVNVRAAVAGYVLRRWNVDCSENHVLTGDEFHLCLRNVAALYAVDNLSIAPGYQK